jgi:hypothetical protein
LPVVPPVAPPVFPAKPPASAPLPDVPPVSTLPPALLDVVAPPAAADVFETPPAPAALVDPPAGWPAPPFVAAFPAIGAGLPFPEEQPAAAPSAKRIANRATTEDRWTLLIHIHA